MNRCCMYVVAFLTLVSGSCFKMEARPDLDDAVAGPVKSLRYSADGVHLYVAAATAKQAGGFVFPAAGGPAALLPLGEWSAIRLVRGPAGGGPICLNGRGEETGGRPKEFAQLGVWDLAGTKQRIVVDEPDGYASFTRDIAADPARNRVALIGGGTIRVHDLKTGELVKELRVDKKVPTHPAYGPNASVSDACYSPDGKLIATTDTNREVVLWDTAQNYKQVAVLVS